jgi:dihydroorotate dehydrogenase electron transfer subunit
MSTSIYDGFVPDPLRPRILLIGGGASIASTITLAQRLYRSSDAEWKLLVLLGSDEPFPFRARPSTILVPGLPQGVIACVPALEEFGVPSRLATLADFPGCYDGTVDDLAAAWLDTLDAATLSQVEIFACGPAELLQAAADLAQRCGIPCQSSPDRSTK